MFRHMFEDVRFICYFWSTPLSEALLYRDVMDKHCHFDPCETLFYYTAGHDSILMVEVEHTEALKHQIRNTACSVLSNAGAGIWFGRIVFHKRIFRIINNVLTVLQECTTMSDKHTRPERDIHSTFHSNEHYMMRTVISEITYASWNPS